MLLVTVVVIFNLDVEMSQSGVFYEDVECWSRYVLN